MTYKSVYKGLKIVISPASTGRDAQGNPVKKEGKYIQFVNGEYKTNNPENIKYLSAYMKKWSGEVTGIDEKQLEKEKKITVRVKKELEKEVE